jgi:hypothetical protein
MDESNSKDGVFMKEVLAKSSGGSDGQRTGPRLMPDVPLAKPDPAERIGEPSQPIPPDWQGKSKNHDGANQESGETSR